MQPRSRLDVLVERFRDRWMTDPQYRARMSAVLGVLVLVALCSCMGVFAVAANAVLASGGLAGSSPTQSSGGSSPISGGPVIPTNTVPLWTPGTVPEAPPVPASGTPPPTPTLPPTPTAAPTATPCRHCTTPTPGGSGGEVTGPNPWTQCKNAQDKCDTVVVHTGIPNATLTMTVTDCAGAQHPGPSDPSNLPPNQAGGSGDASYSVAQLGPTNQPNAIVVIAVLGGQPQTFNLACGG